MNRWLLGCLVVVCMVGAVCAQEESSSAMSTIEPPSSTAPAAGQMCGETVPDLEVDAPVQIFSDLTSRMYPTAVDGFGPYTDFEFGFTAKFTRSGYVTALRFFYMEHALTLPTAPWILSLWEKAGSTPLATTSLALSAVVPGWNTVALPSRVLVRPDLEYGVSVGFTGTGSFAKSSDAKKAFAPAMLWNTTTIVPIGTYVLNGGLGTNPFSSSALRSYIVWVDVVYQAETKTPAVFVEPVCSPYILALGSAIGSGAVVTLGGTDTFLNLTIKAGTGAAGAGNGAVQISFCRTFATNPIFTVIPTNAAALGKNMNVNGATSKWSWTFWQYGSALTAGVVYTWNIKVDTGVYGLIAREPVDRWNTTAVTLAAPNYVPLYSERAQEMADTLGPALARVAFIGDSIFGNFMGDGLAVWNREFAEAPYHAINLGVSGDKTNNVLWRLNANLANVGPQCTRFVILIGTNNFPVNGATGQTTNEAIRMITARIQARSNPNAPPPRILIINVIPRPDKTAQVKAVNERMRSDHEDISRSVRVMRLDEYFWSVSAITAMFTGKSYGNLGNAETDWLHINAAGYEVLARDIKNWLEATEDY
jgi:lysophospholipase L1-like esterase